MTHRKAAAKPQRDAEAVGRRPRGCAENGCTLGGAAHAQALGLSIPVQKLSHPAWMMAATVQGYRSWSVSWRPRPMRGYDRGHAGRRCCITVFPALHGFPRLKAHSLDSAVNHCLPCAGWGARRKIAQSDLQPPGKSLCALNGVLLGIPRAIGGSLFPAHDLLRQTRALTR